MNSPSPRPLLPRGPALRWFLFFALWTIIGVAFASQLYLSRFKIGDPVSWTFALGRALADWYIFALLSIPALWLARRFPFEGLNWQRPLGVHLAAGAVFSILWMALRALVEEWQTRSAENPISFTAAFNHVLVATFFFNLLIYLVIVSIRHTLDYYVKFRERELHTAELQKSLAAAKLHALQMQLNPHFLFNTLHSVSSLMHQDVEAADRMITQLGTLLRQALENSDAQEVTLRDELSFLGQYIAIEKTRFAERLSVQLDIAPDTLDARVPNLVLQPLVENAIQHGIEPHAKPGVIVLTARRDAGTLALQVRDNGSGLTNGAHEEGVGLSNTRARLRELYGKAQSFELGRATEGGLLVTVKLPFHTLVEDGLAEMKRPSNGHDQAPRR